MRAWAQRRQGPPACPRADVSLRRPDLWAPLASLRPGGFQLCFGNFWRGGASPHAEREGYDRGAGGTSLRAWAQRRQGPPACPRADVSLRRPDLWAPLASLRPGGFQLCFGNFWRGGASPHAEREGCDWRHGVPVRSRAGAVLETALRKLAPAVFEIDGGERFGNADGGLLAPRME